MRSVTDPLLPLGQVPTHLPILMEAVGHPELFVREKALQCLVDVLLLWGPPAPGPPFQ